MTVELEKAVQEIERLRQENAELRKKLGLEVSEPKSDYAQSSPTYLQEAQTTGQRTLAISAVQPAVDFNSSTREKIKLFRRFLGGEKTSMHYSGSMSAPGKRDIRRRLRMHGF